MMACLLAPLDVRQVQQRSTVSLGASDTSWWGLQICCRCLRVCNRVPEWSCVGEQAPECGGAYCRCGRALLELARKEAGVLGPDLDGASSQEGSTGEEEDEEEES
ncbi:hypothetical protein O3P69_011959 [Scylla paramamosain]|uniref:Uncharacterized protein n=1 Tax=Scylla paramamosain TaxID=85552 RepID=A0AAW0SIL5_SCYPA